MNYVRGDYDSALHDYVEALELFIACDNPWGINAARMNLGAVQFRLGEFLESISQHVQALRYYQAAETLDGIVWSLERLAITQAHLGKSTMAAVLFGAASSERQQLGQLMDEWDHADWSSAISITRQQMGDVEFDAAWTKGGKMGRTAAIAFALSG